jgi:hypothetical protein
VVQRPEEYQRLQDELPVVLKIHGAINRRDEQQDSYGITEDDYFDYLTRTDVASLLPNPLPAQLQSSRFLFLGYSLNDWNLRAIVQRLWSERRRTIISWAILKELEELERRFWMGVSASSVKRPPHSQLSIVSQATEHEHRPTRVKRDAAGALASEYNKELGVAEWPHRKFFRPDLFLRREVRPFSTRTRRPTRYSVPNLSL